MKVQVIRSSDDYVLNIRYTDELLEQGDLKDEAEADAAERELKKFGRYWISADVYLKPA